MGDLNPTILGEAATIRAGVHKEDLMSTIYDTLDFGYDPSVPEEPRPGPLPGPEEPPPFAMVNLTLLPPVGQQHMPNCFVWSSAYGAATFWAARMSNTPPATPNLQAAPDYTYIKVQIANNVDTGKCIGGQITSVFSFLLGNDGTPSLEAAPNIVPNNEPCSANWDAYGPQGSTIPPGSPNFKIPGYYTTNILGPEGLKRMRRVIASGIPLVYGTRLYTDFAHYKGKHTPYIGSGIYSVNQTTKKWVGHCMLIIGYDDAYPGPHGAPLGAVYIQNSFGSAWGTRGYVWMAYPTFQAMAEGTAFHIRTDNT
jgi:hypothetical protein